MIVSSSSVLVRDLHKFNGQIPLQIPALTQISRQPDHSNACFDIKRTFSIPVIPALNSLRRLGLKNRFFPSC